MKKEEKNLTKICGNGCNKPCKTSWCPTLDNPEEFEDYFENENEEDID
jgi:hypothetical protein